MPFSFFDHTGDIGVRLTGCTLDDLFADAAAAFTEAIADRSCIEARTAVTLALESSAIDLLLVDWLSEILYRFEVEQFLVHTARVHVTRDADDRGRASAAGLHATLVGERFDADRHAIKLLVKAVTYHALEVRENADGWHATVIFDI